MTRQATFRLAFFFGIICGLMSPAPARAQDVPPPVDPRIYDIIAASSPDRIEADIRTLAGFGTRNTMSDTLSETRGSLGDLEGLLGDTFTANSGLPDVLSALNRAASRLTVSCHPERRWSGCPCPPGRTG